MKTSKIGLFVLAAIVAATFVPAFGQDLDEPALELAQIGPTDDGNNRLGKSLLDVVAGVVAKLGRVRHEGTLLLGD